jgi:hypothetical protein
MENGARFINHKGKEIYYVDYSNIKSNEEFLKIIKKTNAFRESVKAAGKRNLLMLVDFTGSYVYGDVLDELKKSGKFTKELTKKEAIVGVTGAKKVLLQVAQAFTGMQFHVFNTVDEAKEWLVKD